MSVTVVGVRGELGRDARAAIAAADVVLGSAANLALAGVPDGVVLGPLAPALDRLAAARRPVVLASGDPGFFGVLRALREMGQDCVVLPAPSSVASAYARAALPWDDAVVVSAHGRSLDPAVNACRAFGNVAVLTGPGAGAVEIARALDGWPRELVVAQHLDRPDERVIRAAATEIAAREPGEFADPHVVLCLAERPSAMRVDNQPAAARTWARPESAFAHRDSMITKAEVRAYALARLRPSLGRLVLDVGAGSGSVGIECNGLGAAAVCVERDRSACATIRANADLHRARIRVVEGEVTAVLGGLPAADAVFVGGGGTDAVKAVIARSVPVVVAAFAALDRAVAAHELLRAAGYRVDGVQLSASRFADLPGGSLRLAAANPVVVITGERA